MTGIFCAFPVLACAFQVPNLVYRYSRQHVFGVPVLEEHCFTSDGAPLPADNSPELGRQLRMHELVHTDSITQLLAVEGVSSKLLVSASRDGCVKVWK